MQYYTLADVAIIKTHTALIRVIAATQTQTGVTEYRALRHDIDTGELLDEASVTCSLSLPSLVKHIFSHLTEYDPNDPSDRPITIDPFRVQDYP